MNNKPAVRVVSLLLLITFICGADNDANNNRPLQQAVRIDEPSWSSLSDEQRASTMVPRRQLIATDPASLASLINAHMLEHSKNANIQFKSCEEFSNLELEELFRKMLSMVFESKASFDGKFYKGTNKNDRRSLRLASLQQFETEVSILGESAKENDHLQSIVRSGRCYEAVMLFAHHLTLEMKQNWNAELEIPLLPNAANVSSLHDFLKTARDEHRTIHKVVEDQAICANCHVQPTSKFNPDPSSSKISKKSPHLPLQQPKIYRTPNDGSHQLRVSLSVRTGRVEGPISFNSRLYDGNMPGPTLVVKPGDTIVVDLINELQVTDGCSENNDNHHHHHDNNNNLANMNMYRCPNTTNLHVHGLYVALQDVYTGVPAGGNFSRQYTFELPPDHVAGINWYHPHFHGSVSLQLAGGMAGAIIVEDDEKQLKEYFGDRNDNDDNNKMQDRVLLIQSVEYFNYTTKDVSCPHEAGGISRCHDLDGAGAMSTMQMFSKDSLNLDVQINDDTAGEPIPGNYMVVNGQFQPVIDVKAGVWERWRLINAAHQLSLSIAVGGCEMLLIAMDGVYLQSGTPRPKTTVVIPPGSRADILVRCNKEGSFYLESKENPNVYIYGQQTGFSAGVIAIVQCSIGNKKETNVHHEEDILITTKLPPLPDYLQDLTTAKSTEIDFRVRWDLLYLINNTADLTDVPIYGVNGNAFEMNEISRCIPLSETPKIEHWRIINPIWLCNASQPNCLTSMNRKFSSPNYLRHITLSHGFHLHTFKFQVAAASDLLDYEIGDWRDTIMTPSAGHVDVLWRPSTFTGIVPFHCHMSPHSDRGMGGLAAIQMYCDDDLGKKKDWQPEFGPNYNLRPLTTSSPDSQRYFDMGVMMRYGFDFIGSAEYFNTSAQLSPDCAMCFWGVSYSFGGFLNMPVIPPEFFSQASEAAKQALSLASTVSFKERLLIEAMAARYPSLQNQTLGHLAYVEALMGALEKIPEDKDVMSLLAEALMLLHCESDGFHFFDAANEPVPDIALATKMLESVLMDPDGSGELLPGALHPLAMHLYIHITESGKNAVPFKASTVADRLRVQFNHTQTKSVAQHLQHMSSHTYLRTGRYNDAVKVNIEAHKSDEILMHHGVFTYGPGHNLAVLIYAADMDGQLETTRHYGQVIQKLYREHPDDPDGPGPDRAWNIPLTSLVRFGKWEEILSNNNEPAPRDWPYGDGVLGSYARGVAFARMGRVEEAWKEYERMQGFKVDGKMAVMTKVANWTLLAAISMEGHNLDAALEYVQLAVKEQYSWNYNEPPDWHLPMLQCLGAMHLLREEWTLAEHAFNEDLSYFINNPWSLHGLLEAMKHQPHKYTQEQIAAVQLKTDASWLRATEAFPSSCSLLS